MTDLDQDVFDDEAMLAWFDRDLRHLVHVIRSSSIRETIVTRKNKP